MKIRIIFDGKEHHEYETNEFEESFLPPPNQAYCVRRILDTIEGQLMIPVPNPILTAQEQNTPAK